MNNSISAGSGKNIYEELKGRWLSMPKFHKTNRFEQSGTDDKMTSRRRMPASIVSCDTHNPSLQIYNPCRASRSQQQIHDGPEFTRFPPPSPRPCTSDGCREVWALHARTQKFSSSTEPRGCRTAGRKRVAGPVTCPLAVAVAFARCWLLIGAKT